MEEKVITGPNMLLQIVTGGEFSFSSLSPPILSVELMSEPGPTVTSHSDHASRRKRLETDVGQIA